MAREVLGLTKKASPPPAPKEVPVFDPESLAVTTYGDAGSGYIQGKNYFTSTGVFVRELPEAQWYLTTPEMERNNRIARAKWRAKTAGRGDPSRHANVPDKVMEISRERAQMARAEALAE